MFSIEQIQEIMGIIDYTHTLFTVDAVGGDFLSLSDKNILTRRGVDWRKMKKSGIVDDAYRFGKLASALRPKQVRELTYDQLLKFIASGKYIPLSPEEDYVLNIVKTQMYKDIKTQQGRVAQDLYQISINNAQKKEYQDIIKKEATKAVKERISARELSSALSKKTEDWSRDFDRISDYVLHSAYQHGKANYLLERYGVGVKVFYRVHKDACEHCKRVYLKADKNEPKQFLLVDVLDNGSNIGVKSKDYKPSVYALHPWCRCEMEYLPENSVWDKTKNMFVIGRNTYGVQRKSRIKITRS